jgi:iron complex outermembrane receptor protein
LTASATPLPRIPPLRARVGFEAFFNSFRINPEIVLARAQARIFSTETPTAGYGVVNLNASYTVAGKHVAHVFSVNGFNLTNRLYRNHLSFIKEFAPEIGRGSAGYLHDQILLICQLPSNTGRGSTGSCKLVDLAFIL